MKLKTKALMIGTLLWAPSALAQSEPEIDEACEASAPMTGQRLLRRLSLDLLGRTPLRDEIEAQSGQQEVPGAAIDAMLGSESFLRVIRQQHESLLWPNLEQTELVSQAHMIFPFELQPGLTVYFSPLRAVFVRTAPGGGALYLPCKPEPATFDANGELVVDPVMMGESIIGYQEGYVEVEPYWPVLDAEGNEIPGATVKVCGLDALPASSAPLCPGPLERYPYLDPICEGIQAYAVGANTPFRNAETSCDGPLSLFAPGCACGPNLRHCQSPETMEPIKRALLDQEMRLVEKVIRERRPYHEILTEKTIEVNGPVAHYLRHQARLNLDLFADPDPDFVVPSNLEYRDQNTWVPVNRSGRHAGVLTTPGYLLRFTSDRGRAHRFYNAFECSSFIPAGPLPSPFDPCSAHEDLTRRCGCNACHQSLEPMAAHWARFAEYGYGGIDETQFPTRIGPTCAQPFRDVDHLFRCVRFYELEPVGEEADFYGFLNGYVFRPESEWPNIEEGPRRLVEASIQSGKLGACTVDRMWRHFMRREPRPEEREALLPQLENSFVASGYDLKALIKDILSQPAYRRLP